MSLRNGMSCRILRTLRYSRALSHLTYDSLDKTTLAVAAVKLMLAPTAAETTFGIFLYAASRLPSSCETELASLFDDCPWS